MEKQTFVTFVLKSMFQQEFWDSFVQSISFLKTGVENEEQACWLELEPTVDVTPS